MADYLPPSVSLREEFQAIPAAAVQTFNACLVGPNRRNFSYGNALDKPLLGLGAYSPGNGGVFAYPALPAGGVVDVTRTSLVLDSLLAQFATLGGAGVVNRPVHTSNQVALGPNAVGAFQGNASAVRLAALGGRDLQVGDRVRVVGQTSGATLLTSVTGFAQSVVAPVVGAFVADPANQAAQARSVTATTLTANGDHAVAEHTATSVYVGNLAKNVLADTYTLTCTAGGVGAAAVFSVTSLQGDNVPALAAPALGGNVAVGTNGLRLTFSGTGAYAVGEQYSVQVRAAVVAQTPTVTGSAYAGTVGTTYQIRVVKGGQWNQGPVVSVSTANGVDYQAPQTVAFNVNFALGNLGLVAKFATATTQNGLVAGDVYTVGVAAAYAGAVSGFFVADPLPAALTNVEDLALTFYLAKASLAVPATGYPFVGSVAWTTDGANVSVAPNLQVTDPAFVDALGNLVALPVVAANLYLSYSALLTAQAGVLQTLSDVASVQAVLGRVEAANPLAYGVNKALLNSAGQPVNFVAIDQDNLQGYTDALAALEKVDQTYFCVPLSSDVDVQELFLAHALAQSNPDVGHERVALGVRPLSPTLSLYDAKGDGSHWTGSVALNPAAMVPVFTRLSVPGATFLTDGVRAGDTVRSQYVLNADGTLAYATAAVAQVLDNQTLLLAGTGFGAALGTAAAPVRVAIVRSLTADELAAQGAANAGLFGNRRYFNVFPNRNPDSSVRAGAEPHWAYAAAVAGFKSAVAPHQGITNAVLLGFTENLQFFTPKRLNVVAAGGNLIVTQDTPGGAVYVRHQLSTDMTDANTQEMSITVNADSILRFIRADLKPLLGTYNITQGFLQQIFTLILHKMDYLQQQTVTATAGPQVTSFDPKDLSVQGDDVSRTLADLALAYGLPYPCNNIRGPLTVL